jgi:phosphoglycerol transferase MdoB-like AlkP superfamily enzyme
MKRIGQNTFTTLLLRLLVVYGLLALCRSVFYVMNADSLGALARQEWGSLIRGSLVFDTVSVLYTNCLFIFFSLIPFRIRERRWYRTILFWIYTLTNGVLVVALNLSDSVYFHYAKKRITAEELHFAENDNTLSLIGQFIGENWFLVLVAIALIWAMVWLYRRIPDWKLLVKNPWGYGAISLIGLAAAGVLAVGGIRGGFTRQVRPLTLSNAAQYASSPQQASLILSNPFCTIRTLGNHRIDVPNYFSPQELAAIFTPYHYPPLADSTARRRNIVIFTLESFSAEHSAYLNPDLYPDGQGYTPFLDSLMRVGYTFMNAYSNGRKSIEALPSILTSIPSYQKSFVLLPQALGEMRGMPKLLGDEGYATAFFCGSQRNSMGFAAFAQMAGIEQIYMLEEYEAAKGNVGFDGAWGIWDEPFLQYTGETLTTLSEPFMASVFTLSSHHPFHVPAEYENTFRPGTTKMHRPVQYTDQALRRFFDYARGQAWFENTLFVFSADHVSSEIFAPKTVTPTGNSHILMFLYTPDGSLVGKDTHTAQQIDLMPTILGLTGYEKPYFAFGRDVFREPERPAVATNYFNEAYQYIADSIVLFSTGDRTLSAYLPTDTLQQHDIHAEHLPAQTDGERLLRAILQQYYTHLQAQSYIVPEE